jgi:hypothetical protein
VVFERWPILRQGTARRHETNGRIQENEKDPIEAALESETGDIGLDGGHVQRLPKGDGAVRGVCISK